MSGLQIHTTQNTPRNPSSKSSRNPHRFGDIKANVQQAMLVENFYGGNDLFVKIVLEGGNL